MGSKIRDFKLIHYPVVTTVGLDHAHATETKSFLPEDIFFGPVRRGAKC